MTRRMSSYDPRSFQSNRNGWVWRWRDKVRKMRWLVRQNNWCVNFGSTKDSFFGVQSRQSASKMTRRISSYDLRSFQSNRSRWVWRWRDKVRKLRWLVRQNKWCVTSGSTKVSFSGVQSRRSSSKMARRMSSYDPRSFQSNRRRWVWR